MGKQIYTATVNGAGGLPATGATQYGGITGNWDNGTTDETRARCYLRTSGGTFSYLSVRIKSNTYSVNGTMTFRKNGADGNQSVSVTASTTGLFQDTLNTDSCSTDDYVDLKWSSSSGSGSISGSFVSVVFAPSSNYRFFSHNRDGNISNTNANCKALNGNRTAADASESLMQDKARVSGTLQKLETYVYSNSSVTNTTVASRINSSDGNLSVSVTALTTGLFSDLSNSDTISVGDTLNTRSTGAAPASNVAISFISCNFLADSSNENILIGAGPTVLSGETRFRPLMNGANIVTSPESDAKVPINFDFKCQKLEVNITSNTTTSASTCTLKKNESATSLVASITAGTTGYFSDLSNTAEGSAGDFLDLAFTNGGGGFFAGSPAMVMNEVTSGIKSRDGLAKASIKTINGLAIASVKTIDGLA